MFQKYRKFLGLGIAALNFSDLVLATFYFSHHFLKLAAATRLFSFVHCAYINMVEKAYGRWTDDQTNLTKNTDNTDRNLLIYEKVLPGTKSKVPPSLAGNENLSQRTHDGFETRAVSCIYTGASH